MSAVLGTDPAVDTVIRPPALPRRVPGVALGEALAADTSAPMEIDAAVLELVLERLRKL